MKARAIAFYLPQFHPIPENDEWWGRGFTEWTNTAKAKPLFRGHYQPHVPADLGFYDLRLPEAREDQASLARQYGIEAFCYYHYWFAGRRILQRPFQEVLSSGKPDFPFCLCWANETWTGVWHGTPNHILIKQDYPGEADHRAHFEALLPAFRDPRYVRVEGKPLFLIYRCNEFPDPVGTVALWRRMAAEAGLKSLYIVGVHAPKSAQDYGLDATMINMPRIARSSWVSKRTPIKWVKSRIQDYRKPVVHDYGRVVENMIPVDPISGDVYPSLVHAWDNTPRSGKRGVVFHDSRPELFRVLMRSVVDAMAAREPDKRLLFLKSWNEWAEGNHLEPDLKFGCDYLQVVKDELSAERDR